MGTSLRIRPLVMLQQQVDQIVAIDERQHHRGAFGLRPRWMESVASPAGWPWRRLDDVPREKTKALIRIVSPRAWKYRYP